MNKFYAKDNAVFQKSITRNNKTTVGFVVCRSDDNADKITRILNGEVNEKEIRAAAIACCQSWPKDPNGCAALCMDRLGSIPKEGCHHAVAVHGNRVKKIIKAAMDAS